MYFLLLPNNGVSFNGRTADSGSADWGSNPCTPATERSVTSPFLLLSIYLLIDGACLNRWLRTNLPLSQQTRVHFFLDTLERVIGGYIRGQLILSLLIGLLVGFGMALLHVPFAILLGVLAFVFAFVPVLGTFISGAACVLLALTQGWVWAVIVLIYFIGIHIFEGDLVGPRIVGKAVGLHPIVSLVALIAGSELFGIWGAIFASPIAGILQAILMALWLEWRETHRLDRHAAPIWRS